MQWFACPRSNPDVVRPLVVMFPWVWAEDQQLFKYLQLCHGAQWDVLVVRWHMLAMWFPPWSSSLAARVLQEVGSDLATRGERPVVFWTFSGAAKVCPLRL